MPFDGLHPSTPIDLLWDEAKAIPPGIARLRALIYILQHPELEQKWAWNYESTTYCAIGICRYLWNMSDVSHWDAEEKLGLNQGDAYNIFRGLFLHSTAQDVASYLETSMEGR